MSYGNNREGAAPACEQISPDGAAMAYVCAVGERHPGRQNSCTPMISSGNFQCNSMTNVFLSLLLVIAGATQKELVRQIKYLKVENEILRR